MDRGLKKDILSKADALVESLAEVNISLSYDKTGVASLDAYIERNRTYWNKENHTNLSVPFGCFLGECIIRCFGGEWIVAINGAEPALLLQSGATALPITKAYKQLCGSSPDGILSFFDVSGTILTNKNTQ